MSSTVDVNIPENNTHQGANHTPSEELSSYSQRIYFNDRNVLFCRTEAELRSLLLT